jgi:hypothetical protein
MAIASELRELDILGMDWGEGDDCPNHSGSSHKKTYTFGSSMYAEGEVCVFKGCGCAVSILHNPGGGNSSAAYHKSYNSASGRARLHVMIWKDKLR